MTPIARASGAGGLAPGRLTGEAGLDLGDADTADHGHAVPLVVAGGRDVVAEGGEAHHWELVLARLGLLQREHVDVVALQEGLDPVDPAAQ